MSLKQIAGRVFISTKYAGTFQAPGTKKLSWRSGSKGAGALHKSQLFSKKRFSIIFVWRLFGHWLSLRVQRSRCLVEIRSCDHCPSILGFQIVSHVRSEKGCTWQNLPISQAWLRTSSHWLFFPWDRAIDLLLPIPTGAVAGGPWDLRRFTDQYSPKELRPADTLKCVVKCCEHDNCHANFHCEILRPYGKPCTV